MNARLILFPTDFSTCSDAGLAQATSLARDSGARLLILHVEEPPAVYGGGDMYYGVLEPDDAEIRQMLEAVVPTDPAIPYEHRMTKGDPADQIVEVARQEGADMIVMGTHGRTGLRRLLMGSVAEAVVRRAPCPVLTFKQPAETVPAHEPPAPVET
jgi:nucleotide-binding universal stress UspA family protein